MFPDWQFDLVCLHEGLVVSEFKELTEGSQLFCLRQIAQFEDQV